MQLEKGVEVLQSCAAGFRIWPNLYNFAGFEFLKNKKD